MSNKTLGDIFQEINDEFTDMEPTNIDQLENRVLAAMGKLGAYLMESKRHGIWYKEARDKGISIGAGSADKAGDILICRRMKLRGMWWSRKGADAVLSMRILICNGEWDDFWAKSLSEKS